MKERSIDLGQCIIDCNGEQSCEQSCVNMFKVQYDRCPCQVWIERITISVFKWLFKDDCPFGCPCDSFDCQPDKKSVLVLNTYSSNKPVLIKFDGEFNQQIIFDCKIVKAVLTKTSISLWVRIPVHIIHVPQHSMVNYLFLVVMEAVKISR